MQVANHSGQRQTMGSPYHPRLICLPERRSDEVSRIAHRYWNKPCRYSHFHLPQKRMPTTMMAGNDLTVEGSRSGFVVAPVPLRDDRDDQQLVAIYEYLRSVPPATPGSEGLARGALRLSSPRQHHSVPKTFSGHELRVHPIGHCVPEPTWRAPV